MAFVARWREQADRLKREVYALFLACRDPRVPWYAKAVAAALVAYAFSPIDLIPDVIPVLGYLDDLVLIPLGVLVVRAMIPPHVMQECRDRALTALSGARPVSRLGLAMIVGIWVAAAAAGIWVGFRVVIRLTQ